MKNIAKAARGEESKENVEPFMPKDVTLPKRSRRCLIMILPLPDLFTGYLITHFKPLFATVVGAHKASPGGYGNKAMDDIFADTGGGELSWHLQEVSCWVRNFCLLDRLYFETFLSERKHGQIFGRSKNDISTYRPTINLI